VKSRSARSSATSGQNSSLHDNSFITSRVRLDRLRVRTPKKSADFLTSELVNAAGALKLVKRAGWLKKVGVTSDRESVADHSFRMALMGLERGLELGLDSSKIVRMCLIHDLAESVMGDRLPEEKYSQSWHRKEEDKIMHELLPNTGSLANKILLKDWVELSGAKTAEAKLVWKIDKMEMAFQARAYEMMGYDRKKLLEFMRVKSS
jgi:putative hydrolases of HD superfamily